MHSIRVIRPSNANVYRRLNRLADPPRQLFLKGEYDPAQPAVAIIGSRKHSSYGRLAAESLTGDLASHGVTIISGLALGIDSLAHRAALSRQGRTVAVMPGGLDRVYPASHRQLADQLVNGGGGLISEYPPGTLPAKHHFVARNRIVAALSDAVVVVEAASRSGTLITAEYALDIGLPVLAVPGPITSPTSIGTNRLIDTGAKLIASAGDILLELGLEGRKPAGTYLAASPLGQDIIDRLKFGPMSASQLALEVKAKLNQLNRELTHLELDSAIVNLGNNTWSLRSDLRAGS